MYHSFFTHSSIGWYVGCFQYLAIVNSTAMNIGVNRFFWSDVSGFLGYNPSSGIASLFKTHNLIEATAHQHSERRVRGSMLPFHGWTCGLVFSQPYVYCLGDIAHCHLSQKTLQGNRMSALCPRWGFWIVCPFRSLINVLTNLCTSRNPTMFAEPNATKVSIFPGTLTLQENNRLPWKKKSLRSSRVRNVWLNAYISFFIAGLLRTFNFLYS